MRNGTGKNCIKLCAFRMFGLWSWKFIKPCIQCTVILDRDFTYLLRISEIFCTGQNIHQKQNMDLQKGGKMWILHFPWTVSAACFSIINGKKIFYTSGHRTASHGLSEYCFLYSVVYCFCLLNLHLPVMSLRFGCNRGSRCVNNAYAQKPCTCMLQELTHTSDNT